MIKNTREYTITFSQNCEAEKVHAESIDFENGVVIFDKRDKNPKYFSLANIIKITPEFILSEEVQKKMDDYEQRKAEHLNQ